MTRLSAEQVIIVQLQGSTESPSQLSRTPWGSSKVAFIAIKAWTAKPKQKNNQVRMKKLTENQIGNLVLSPYINTFKINTFGREHTNWRTPKTSKYKKQENIIFSLSLFTFTHSFHRSYKTHSNLDGQKNLLKKKTSLWWVIVWKKGNPQRKEVSSLVNLKNPQMIWGLNFRFVGQNLAF